MSANLQTHLYRRLASVGSDVADIEPLVRELERCLLNLEELPAPWDAKDCLEKLASRERQSTVALAVWLTGEESVKCAKRLLRILSVHTLQVREEPVLDVSGIEVAKLHLCASRLCSRADSTVLSLRWTLALAGAGREFGEETVSFAGKLMEYHVEEFPRTTRELLTKCSAVYKDVELASSALEYLDAEETRLRALPILPELAMNDSMRIAVSSHERNQQRAILRGADERSVLAKLFTQQHFKYSRQAVVQVHAGGKVHEQTLQMSEYSVYVELPMSETLDPQKGAHRRRRLWVGQA